jgi:phosphocarrier protein FPr
MAPMVTVADEVVTLRAELAAARTSLEDEGREAGDLDGLGVMVEVPAAALAVSELAPLLDFVSVGTNDLVQYLMAAERTNAAVAHLYRPDHPAVWRTLELLVAAAHAGGCEVSVCGQMAAEPDSALRLVELGVDDLSVPPSDVGRIKEALRGS